MTPKHHKNASIRKYTASGCFFFCKAAIWNEKRTFSRILHIFNTLPPSQSDSIPFSVEISDFSEFFSFFLENAGMLCYNETI